MSKPGLSLVELDGVIDSAGLPVRMDTLVEAWDLSPAVEPRPPAAGKVLLIVTLRARPGLGTRLEGAAREFVASTSRLEGALGSRLIRSARDADEWILLERFIGRMAFEQHMASDYFHKFQVEQQGLLSQPVEALFLESGL